MEVNDNHYICSDCHRKVSKGQMPAMSHKNSLGLVGLEGKEELKW